MSWLSEVLSISCLLLLDLNVKLSNFVFVCMHYFLSNYGHDVKFNSGMNIREKMSWFKEKHKKIIMCVFSADMTLLCHVNIQDFGNHALVEETLLKLRKKHPFSRISSWPINSINFSLCLRLKLCLSFSLPISKSSRLYPFSWLKDTHLGHRPKCHLHTKAQEWRGEHSLL